MAPPNQAAWIPSPGARLEVGPSETGVPGPHDLLIKNHAWAINPIDWKIQAFGMFIDSYPSIFGCDIAGEVVRVGGKVRGFEVCRACYPYPSQCAE